MEAVVATTSRTGSEYSLRLSLRRRVYCPARDTRLTVCLRDTRSSMPITSCTSLTVVMPAVRERLAASQASPLVGWCSPVSQSGLLIVGILDSVYICLGAVENRFYVKFRRFIMVV